MIYDMIPAIDVVVLLLSPQRGKVAGGQAL